MGKEDVAVIQACKQPLTSSPAVLENQPADYQVGKHNKRVFVSSFQVINNQERCIWSGKVIKKIL